MPCGLARPHSCLAGHGNFARQFALSLAARSRPNVALYAGFRLIAGRERGDVSPVQHARKRISLAAAYTSFAARAAAFSTR